MNSPIKFDGGGSATIWYDVLDMEQDVLKKLEELDAKLDATLTSVEKTRKYFLIITWVTILLIVLPAIGLIFAVPQFLNTYTTSLEGL